MCTCVHVLGLLHNDYMQVFLCVYFYLFLFINKHARRHTNIPSLLNQCLHNYCGYLIIERMIFHSVNIMCSNFNLWTIQTIQYFQQIDASSHCLRVAPLPSPRMKMYMIMMMDNLLIVYCDNRTRPHQRTVGRLKQEILYRTIRYGFQCDTMNLQLQNLC